MIDIGFFPRYTRLPDRFSGYRWYSRHDGDAELELERSFVVLYYPVNYCITRNVYARL